jgi:hypothetical protein
MKKRVKLDQIKLSKGRTDWAYLKHEKAEIFDANAPKLSSLELAQMEKVSKEKPKQ